MPPPYSPREVTFVAFQPDLNKSSILDDSFKGRSFERPLVYWDVDDPSILTKIDPESTFQKIKMALMDKGQYGSFQVCAYVDFNVVLSEDLIYYFAGYGIFLHRAVEGGKRTARLNTMALTTVLWAMHNEPICILLLSREKGFEPVVAALKKKHFQIGLFDPCVFLCFRDEGSVYQSDASLEDITQDNHTCPTDE